MGRPFCMEIFEFKYATYPQFAFTMYSPCGICFLKTEDIILLVYNGKDHPVFPHLLNRYNLESNNCK